MLKHQRTAWYFNNTEMKIRQRDLEVASRCLETEFSLTGEEREDKIEGVALLKYLRRPLDQSDDAFPLVRWNTRKAQHIWGRSVVIFRREGVKPITSAYFYRAAVQAMILFGAETKILSASTEKQIAGPHTGFLLQVRGKRARRQQDGT